MGQWECCDKGLFLGGDVETGDPLAGDRILDAGKEPSSGSGGGERVRRQPP